MLEPPTGFSLILEAVSGALLFAPRKVLLTETALKVAGFLIADEVRAWFLSPSRCFVPSVSEPPLTLASAELHWSSTFAMRLLKMSSPGAGIPFRFEA